MNLRSVLLTVAMAVAFAHSGVSAQYGTAETVPHVYGAAPAASTAPASVTSAPQSAGPVAPATTTAKPVATTSAPPAATTAKPVTVTSAPPAATTAKPVAVTSAPPAATTAKPVTPTSATPAATTAKPLTTTSATTKPPANASTATGYGAATTTSTNCREVSVEGDATYCIQGAICSGGGDKAAGTSCPKKGDVAVRHCLKTLKSYTSADKCVAPVNSVCKKIKSGAWGCVWDTAATSTAPAAATGYGAATPASTTVKPASTPTSAPHVYGAATPASTTAKPATSAPHVYGAATPASTTAKPSNTTTTSAPHVYGAATPASTTAKPANTSSPAATTVKPVTTPSATTTVKPAAAAAAATTTAPTSTTSGAEYVAAYKSFSVEGEAESESDGSVAATVVPGVLAAAAVAAVAVAAIYKRKKRTAKSDASAYEVVSPRV